MCVCVWCVYVCVGGSIIAEAPAEWVWLVDAFTYLCILYDIIYIYIYIKLRININIIIYLLKIDAYNFTHLATGRFTTEVASQVRRV